MIQVDEQVALVTGASRGIGAAVAESLCAAGMRVALLARDADRLSELATTLDGTGERVHPAAVDVTDRTGVADAVAGVEARFGRIDLVVNAAGSIESAELPQWEVDPDEWWRVVEVNLRGPALLLWAVAPGMVRRGSGRVVHVSSGMAGRRVPEYSAYASSKGALMRLTDSVAGPLGERGVGVFDVTPGLVRTDMAAGMAMWREHPPEAFYGTDRICAVVCAIAEGRIDALSGRFLHAGKDDVDDLVARAESIAAEDTRTLRIKPYGPADRSL